MALVTRRVFLEAVLPIHQAKRFRAKINIQRPKPPHYEKAKFLLLTKPFYPSSYRDKKPAEICSKAIDPHTKDDYNPFQQILATELYRWFTKSRLIGLYHVNSMSADDQFKAFAMFKKQNMHFKAYGKSTMKMAVEGTPYEAVLNLYVSRNLIVFSPEPNIKSMLKISNKFPELILLAGIFEGKFLSKKELMEYNSIPDLKTAQAVLVQTLNNIGGHLVGQLSIHPNILISSLQERVKQLEKPTGSTEAT